MHGKAEERWVCHGCVGETFLKAKIESEGNDQECSFCDGTRKCILLEQLADEFDAAFERHLYRTATEPSDFEYLLIKEADYHWERPGDPVLEVMQELGEIDEDLAEAVRSILNDRHGTYDEFQEEDDFDAESYYSYSPINTVEYSEAWRAFTEDLKTGSRYFNRTAEATLSELFEGLDQYRTREDKRVIVPAGPGTEVLSLHRARVFQSSERLAEALKRPEREIGSPPSRSAAAGRMNARGISVFYGATSPEIALAEVRPFVGSRVVIANFEIIRPLQLLDIEALESVILRGSLFDPVHSARLEKVEFLGQLSRLMTAPVMPDDEPFDYLPTQAIADFLATGTDQRLDGIIYPSAQGAREAKNVVLFHKAARVAEMDIPEGTEISAYLDTMTDDGPEDDYRVFEETPKADKMQDADAQNPFMPALRPINPSEDFRDPALKIVVESVQVRHVTEIEFKTDDFQVHRHRTEKRDPGF